MLGKRVSPDFSFVDFGGAILLCHAVLTLAILQTSNHISTLCRRLAEV